jgi:hypothetical protein
MSAFLPAMILLLASTAAYAQPAVGLSQLDPDTRDDRFLIASSGLGVAWTTEAQNNHLFDIAADVGGDAPGMGFSFTLEF